MFAAITFKTMHKSVKTSVSFDRDSIRSKGSQGQTVAM